MTTREIPFTCPLRALGIRHPSNFIQAVAIALPRGTPEEFAGVLLRRALARTLGPERLEVLEDRITEAIDRV